ncbi:hypothetical protein SASPL_136081 [Salvia splendens]|uniref:Uncharacterized protein n=1 Tax=Salvia splendens TaxID=180675 RepID=A0A8X8X1C1_SALSN|nr:hypothetical protein SASPL_136081 [Salvia splendens]
MYSTWQCMWRRMPDPFVALRFHTSVCDRTTAVSLLRELMEMVGGSGTEKGIGNEGEGKMGIEGLIPVGMTRKTLWAHGRDVLGYSVNSFRLTNLPFQNTKLPRRSEVIEFVRHDFEVGLHNEISRFYHSAILNIHRVKGSENVWDLAKTCYTDFADSKKCNKHFSDMADLNFLMSKAIDNPSLTASSSLRTSLLTVFEDPVLDDSLPMQRKIGAEDYIGCASVHGVGPSLAIFDTVRDGCLDCACVYPAPLHSRDQITDLVHRMTRVLIDGVILI